MPRGGFVGTSDFCLYLAPMLPAAHFGAGLAAHSYAVRTSRWRDAGPDDGVLQRVGDHCSRRGLDLGTGRITRVAKFLKPWALVTLAAASMISAADALLLERSRGLFTGGFLSVDHLQGSGAIAAFIVLSILVDAAAAGLLAGLAMFVLARWRARTPAVIAGGFLLATGPLVAAQILEFQLVRFLGTGFDLALMFDLTGRSVGEMLAVSASHLLIPALLLAGASLLAAGVIWIINKAPAAVFAPPPLRVLAVPVLVLIGACLALTVAVSRSASLENGLLRKPSGQALRVIVSSASDVDRDGFGLIGAPADPDPFNGRVFPYAADIPGNGIDENGLAGDLPPDAPQYPETPVPQGAWLRTPDVVLFGLESFRADLVGASHDGQPVTPALNALAARGLSSGQAFSHNGYTVQSRFHLFAGTLTARAGARTLVDDFLAQGYVVGYFSGQDESFGSDDYRVGFDRAHVASDARSDIGRRYSTFATPGSLAVPAQVVQERIEAFLTERAGDPRPMFMYVSFEDTHFPYAHRGIETLVSDVRLPRDQIVPEQRTALWATYVNTAANVDRAIGAVLDRVRQVRGRDPAVVITADHGESLFDHGFLGHGYGLNDVQTRVPLIVVDLPMRVPEPFSHIDLRSALNAALMVSSEAAAMPVTEPTDRPVFQYLGDLRRPRQIAWYRGGARFIYDFRSGGVQAWDEGWRVPADLTPAEYAEFERLIHQWEWINLARRTGRE
jgi:arylsulfatase A-like enzyme